MTVPDLPGQRDCWLFFHRDQAGHVMLKPDYRAVACRRCGRIDEHQTLKSGALALATSPKSARNRDFWETNDNQLIVSQCCRRVLEANFVTLFEFYDVRGEDGWTAVFPKLVFQSPDDAPLYRPLEFARPGDPFQVQRPRCAICDRFGETTWTAMYFHVPPDVTFAGVRNESRRHALMSYIISRDALDILQQHQLRGIKTVAERFASDP